MRDEDAQWLVFVTATLAAEVRSESQSPKDSTFRVGFVLFSLLAPYCVVYPTSRRSLNHVSKSECHGLFGLVH